MPEIVIEKIEGVLQPAMIPFVLACVQDNRFSLLGISLDPNAIVDQLNDCLNNPSKIFILAKSEEKVVGVLLGEITTFSFSKNPIALEFFFGVDPAFRGQGIFKKLTARFEEWARQKACKLVVLGVNSFATSSTEQAKDRLIKDGYEQYSSGFLKRI